MFPKHALQPTSVVSFLIAAFLGGLCSTDSFSQEPSSRGARTRSDEQGRISDEQFAMFANHPKLESIFANGRNLSTDKVLQVIATMPRLEHMDLREAKATQSAVARFLAVRKSASQKGGR